VINTALANAPPPVPAVSTMIKPPLVEDTQTPIQPVSAVMSYPSLPFPPRRSEKGSRPPLPTSRGSRPPSPTQDGSGTPRKKSSHRAAVPAPLIRQSADQKSPRYIPVPGEENALQLNSGGYESEDLDLPYTRSPRAASRSFSSHHRARAPATSEQHLRRIRRNSMDSPSPTATSGFLTSASYRFREIPTAGLRPRTEREKDEMWAELMAKSEKAGGTLHAAPPEADRLLLI